MPRQTARHCDRGGFPGPFAVGNGTGMRSKLIVEGDYLRAELFDRETIEETQQFLLEAIAEGMKQGVSKGLVVVRASRAIFQVQQYRISEYLKEFAVNASVRIALVGDSNELYSAHQYIELLARQHGVNLMAFRDEAAAIEWLRMQAGSA